MFPQFELRCSAPPKVPQVPCQDSVCPGFGFVAYAVFCVMLKDTSFAFGKLVVSTTPFEYMNSFAIGAMLLDAADSALLPIAFVACTVKL